MKHQIYPCLWFDGQAKAAAGFYCSLFNNAAITQENPLVVLFELEGFRLMGLNGGPRFRFNPAISLTVYCPTIEATDALWNKLFEGGKALMAIDTYPWSARYGWLEDRYGLSWQISVTNTPGAGYSIKPATLFTNEQLGRAEEAMRYYGSIFDDAGIDVLVPYPPGSPFEGNLMYAEHHIGNFQMVAMDGPGEHRFVFNEAISFVVNCDTQAEIDHYWAKLSDGGREDMCGWVQDRFGISWQIVPSMLGALISDPVRGQAAMQAMLQMRKFDIEKLKNAGA